RQIEGHPVDNMLLPGIASLRLPALPKVDLERFKVSERIDAVFNEPVNRKELRVKQRRRRQSNAVGRIEDRLERRDVSKSLVGCVVVQLIGLRELGKGHIRMSEVEIAAQHDLMVDTVEIEQIALDVRIDACERDAGPNATAFVHAPALIAGQVSRVV